MRLSQEIIDKARKSFVSSDKKYARLTFQENDSFSSALKFIAEYMVEFMSEFPSSSSSDIFNLNDVFSENTQIFEDQEQKEKRELLFSVIASELLVEDLDGNLRFGTFDQKKFEEKFFIAVLFQISMKLDERDVGDAVYPRHDENNLPQAATASATAEPPQPVRHVLEIVENSDSDDESDDETLPQQLPTYAASGTIIPFTQLQIDRLKPALLDSQYEKKRQPDGQLVNTGVRQESEFKKGRGRIVKNPDQLSDLAKDAFNHPVIAGVQCCLQTSSPLFVSNIALNPSGKWMLNFDSVNLTAVQAEQSEQGEFVTVEIIPTIKKVLLSATDVPEEFPLLACRTKIKFKFERPNFVPIVDPDSGCVDPVFMSLLTGDNAPTENQYPAVLYYFAKAGIIATQKTNQEKFDLLYNLAECMQIPLDLSGVDLTGVDLTGIDVTGATLDQKNIYQLASASNVIFDLRQKFTYRTPKFELTTEPKTLITAYNAALAKSKGLHGSSVSGLFQIIKHPDQKALNQAIYNVRKEQIKEMLQFATPGNQKRKYIDELLKLAADLSVTPDLSDLNLSHADLDELDLRDMNLTGADLTGASLTGVIIDEKTNSNLSKIMSENLQCQKLFYEISGVARLEITDFKTFIENFKKNYVALLTPGEIKNSPILKLIDKAKNPAQKIFVLQNEMREYPHAKKAKQAFLQTYYQAFKTQIESQNRAFTDAEIIQCRQICDHAGFYDSALILQSTAVVSQRDDGSFSKEKLARIQRTEVEKTQGEGVEQVLKDAKRDFFPEIISAILEYINKNSPGKVAKDININLAGINKLAGIDAFKSLEDRVRDYFFQNAPENIRDEVEKRIYASKKSFELFEKLFIDAVTDQWHLSDNAKKDFSYFLAGHNQGHVGLSLLLLPEALRGESSFNFASDSDHDRGDANNNIVFRTKSRSSHFQNDQKGGPLTLKCKMEYEISVTVNGKKFNIDIEPVDYEYAIHNKKYHLIKMSCKNLWLKSIMTPKSPASEYECREMIYQNIKNHVMLESTITQHEKILLLIQIAEKMKVEKNLVGFDLTGVNFTGINVTASVLDQNNITHLANAPGVIFDSKTPFTYVIAVAGKQIGLHVTPEAFWKEIERIAKRDPDPVIAAKLKGYGKATLGENLLSALADPVMKATCDLATHNLYRKQLVESERDVKSVQSRKVMQQSLVDLTIQLTDAIDTELTRINHKIFRGRVKFKSSDSSEQKIQAIAEKLLSEHYRITNLKDIKNRDVILKAFEKEFSDLCSVVGRYGNTQQKSAIQTALKTAKSQAESDFKKSERGHYLLLSLSQFSKYAQSAGIVLSGMNSQKAWNDAYKLAKKRMKDYLGMGTFFRARDREAVAKDLKKEIDDLNNEIISPEEKLAELSKLLSKAKANMAQSDLRADTRRRFFGFRNQSGSRLMSAVDDVLEFVVAQQSLIALETGAPVESDNDSISEALGVILKRAEKLKLLSKGYVPVTFNVAPDDIIEELKRLRNQLVRNISWLEVYQSKSTSEDPSKINALSYLQKTTLAQIDAALIGHAAALTSVEPPDRVLRNELQRRLTKLTQSSNEPLGKYNIDVDPAVLYRGIIPDANFIGADQKKLLEAALFEIELAFKLTNRDASNFFYTNVRQDGDKFSFDATYEQNGKVHRFGLAVNNLFLGGKVVCNEPTMRESTTLRSSSPTEFVNELVVSVKKTIADKFISKQKSTQNLENTVVIVYPTEAFLVITRVIIKQTELRSLFERMGLKKDLQECLKIAREKPNSKEAKAWNQIQFNLLKEHYVAQGKPLTATDARCLYETAQRCKVRCDFSDLNLQKCDLSLIDLSGVDLTRANVRGAIMTGEQVAHISRYRSDFTGVIVTGDIPAVTKKLNFTNANLTNAQFEDPLAYRSHAISGAMLNIQNLNNIDFRDVDLRSIKLRDANLRGADLRGADLRGVDLCGADLSYALVDDTTQFDSETKIDVNTKLTDVALSSAQCDALMRREIDALIAASSSPVVMTSPENALKAILLDLISKPDDIREFEKCLVCLNKLFTAIGENTLTKKINEDGTEEWERSTSGADQVVPYFIKLLKDVLDDISDPSSLIKLKLKKIAKEKGGLFENVFTARFAYDQTTLRAAIEALDQENSAMLQQGKNIKIADEIPWSDPKNLNSSVEAALSLANKLHSMVGTSGGAFESVVDELFYSKAYESFRSQGLRGMVICFENEAELRENVADAKKLDVQRALMDKKHEEIIARFYRLACDPSNESRYLSLQLHELQEKLAYELVLKDFSRNLSFGRRADESVQAEEERSSGRFLQQQQAARQLDLDHLKEQLKIVKNLRTELGELRGLTTLSLEDRAQGLQIIRDQFYLLQDVNADITNVVWFNAEQFIRDKNPPAAVVTTTSTLASDISPPAAASATAVPQQTQQPQPTQQVESATSAPPSTRSEYGAEHEAAHERLQVAAVTSPQALVQQPPAPVAATTAATKAPQQSATAQPAAAQAAPVGIPATGFTVGVWFQKKNEPEQHLEKNIFRVISAATNQPLALADRMQQQKEAIIYPKTDITRSLSRGHAEIYTELLKENFGQIDLTRSVVLDFFAMYEDHPAQTGGYVKTIGLYGERCDAAFSDLACALARGDTIYFVNEQEQLEAKSKTPDPNFQQANLFDKLKKDSRLKDHDVLKSLETFWKWVKEQANSITEDAITQACKPASGNFLTGKTPAGPLAKLYETPVGQLIIDGYKKGLREKAQLQQIADARAAEVDQTKSQFDILLKNINSNPALVTATNLKKLIALADKLPGSGPYQFTNVDFSSITPKEFLSCDLRKFSFVGCTFANNQEWVPKHYIRNFKEAKIIVDQINLGIITPSKNLLDLVEAYYKENDIRDLHRYNFINPEVLCNLINLKIISPEDELLDFLASFAANQGKIMTFRNLDLKNWNMKSVDLRYCVFDNCNFTNVLYSPKTRLNPENIYGSPDFKAKVEELVSKQPKFSVQIEFKPKGKTLEMGYYRVIDDQNSKIAGVALPLDKIVYEFVESLILQKEGKTEKEMKMANELLEIILSGRVKKHIDASAFQGEMGQAAFLSQMRSSVVPAVRTELHAFAEQIKILNQNTALKAELLACKDISTMKILLESELTKAQQQIEAQKNVAASASATAEPQPTSSPTAPRPTTPPVSRSPSADAGFFSTPRPASRSPSPEPTAEEKKDDSAELKP